MFQVPRDMVDVPVPANARSRLGHHVQRQDQQLVHPEPQPHRPVARQDRQRARLQRPQGDARRAVRPRHPVLRRWSTSRASRRSSTRSAACRSTSRSRSPRASTRRRAALTRIYIPAGPQHMTRQRGAHLRPLAPPRAGRRLRPRPAPAAGAALAARADERAGDRRQPARRSCRRSRTRSRPTSRPSQLPKLLALAESVDTQEHPLVRVLAAVLRDGVPNSPRGYIITPNIVADPHAR